MLKCMGRCLLGVYVIGQIYDRSMTDGQLPMSNSSDIHRMKIDYKDLNIIRKSSFSVTFGLLSEQDDQIKKNFYL